MSTMSDTRPPPPAEQGLTAAQAAQVMGCSSGLVSKLATTGRLSRRLDQATGTYRYDPAECREVVIRHYSHTSGDACRCTAPQPDTIGQCTRCWCLIVIDCPTCHQPAGYPGHRRCTEEAIEARTRAALGDALADHIDNHLGDTPCES